MKLLFTFDDLAGSGGGNKIAKLFNKAGAEVVAQAANPAIKHTAGVAWREMSLTFADSQIVSMRIKETGDIYQILLNGKVIPIKNQDDHAAAIAEIVAKMVSGRAAFQKPKTAALAKLPPAIKTAAPKMTQVLTEKSAALDETIASVRAERAVVDEEIARLKSA